MFGLKVLLCFFLIFCQFHLDFAYKSVDCQKSCILGDILRYLFTKKWWFCLKLCKFTELMLFCRSCGTDIVLLTSWSTDVAVLLPELVVHKVVTLKL